MNVRVVSLEQCEATPATLARLKGVAEEMGLTIDLEHIVIRTLDEARQYRHIGSPTVQIDGMDIEPEARNIGRFGLS